MRIISIEDEKQRPQRSEGGQRLPALTGNHVIELDDSYNSSDSHKYGKPGVTKPDASDEERYENK